VSRDRGGDYASAATSGASQARQCADRFHLMKNLGGVLEGILARHPTARRRGQVETASAIPLEIPPPKLPPKLSPKEVQVSQAKREERLAQYQQIVALCKRAYPRQRLLSE
jgi:hypothetical protein